MIALTCKTMQNSFCVEKQNFPQRSDTLSQMNVLVVLLLASLL